MKNKYYLLYPAPSKDQTWFDFVMFLTRSRLSGAHCSSSHHVEYGRYQYLLDQCGASEPGDE